jgi:hypothetical protein
MRVSLWISSKSKFIITIIRRDSDAGYRVIHAASNAVSPGS